MLYDLGEVKTIIEKNPLLLRPHMMQTSSRLGEDKTTPLHAAAELGRFDIVKYLVKKGALIEKVNLWGEMSLHTAALNCLNSFCCLSESEDLLNGLKAVASGLIGLNY